MLSAALLPLALATLASAQLGAPGLVGLDPTYGPALATEHLFYGDMPTGIAVSRAGRKFVNYPRPAAFTVGELVNGTHEAAFPSMAINSPPSLVNATDSGYGTNYKDYLIAVQTVEVDAQDRLWVLDTGRPVVNNTMLLNSGGGKLLAFDLASNSSTPLKTIVFPLTVAYPETFLNDVRFDLRASATPSGQGVAYITDSSTNGRNGIIVVDLGTGRSWRHLDMHPSTLPEEGFVSAYDGRVFYPVMPAGPLAGVYSQLTVGSDGIALSADGEYLYYCPLAGRAWYRVPTALLRVPPAGPGSTPTSALQARAGVQALARRPSHADGLRETASGAIYLTAPEREGIDVFDPATGLIEEFVRDPRVQWPDTMAVGRDGRLYVTVNQYWLQPTYQNGTDRRKKPFALFSAPIGSGPVLLQ